MSIHPDVMQCPHRRCSSHSIVIWTEHPVPGRAFPGPPAAAAVPGHPPPVHACVQSGVEAVILYQVGVQLVEVQRKTGIEVCLEGRSGAAPHGIQ